MLIIQIGEKLNLSPIDAALELMVLNDARLRILFFYRTEDDMKSFLKHPLGMLGSDGIALMPEGVLGMGKPHPRSYGAHARVLEKYVKNEKILNLKEAIYKMSGQIAKRLNLVDRGIIAEGNWAKTIKTKLNQLKSGKEKQQSP